MVDDGSEFEIGEVAHVGGEHFVYLGAKRWVQVSTLAKWFTCDGCPLRGAVQVAASRFAEAVG